MTKRQKLILKFALLGGVPVLVVVGLIFGGRLLSDDSYVPDGDQEGITRALDREGRAGESGLRFTDATGEAGIDFQHFPFRRTSQIPEDMGPGAAWGDYDGDGDPDLYLVNFGAPVGASPETLAESGATDRLYRNRGDGTFEDVTTQAGVGRAHHGMGASWADFDSDGDVDLLVTAWGEPLLWENLGDGTFVEAAQTAGLSGHGFWTGAAWADFDHDGDLDLYVVGYVQYEPEAEGAGPPGDSDFPFTLNPSSYPPEPNRFFVNQGDGTFVDRAAAAGVRDPEGKGMAAAWVDLDQDGWLDLYVANDVSDNRLYRSSGDGTFEDVSYQALVADYRGAMGIAIGDWDADLDQDLFITHWVAQENALYTSTLSELRGTSSAGMLNFGDDSDRLGLGQISLDLVGWATSFSDFNNDGWLDLWVANGSTMQERGDRTRLVSMHPHLYWNRGGQEGFFEVGEEVGFRVEPRSVARGGAVADYDLDGDLDVLVMHVGGRTRLLRNDSEGGAWLSARLVANSTHPSALGARLTAFVGARGHLREVGAGPSYLSQNDVEVSIGLGAASSVDSLVIEWPGGARDVWYDVVANRRYVVEEGSAPTRVAGGMSRAETQRFWELDREVARAYNAGEWSVAIGGLQEMLDLNPDHEDSLYDLGNAFLEVGRYDEAVQTWRRLLTVYPAASRAWIQVGIVHTMPEAEGMFDLAEAVDAFEAAYDLNREESNPLVLWGEAALAIGDLETAQRVLQAGYGMNDRAASAFLLSAYMSHGQGDSAGAETLFRRAIDASGGLVVEAGLSNEGDTRSERMAEVRRGAAERRLFSACVDLLREGSDVSDSADIYSCVDAELARVRGG